MAKVKDRWHRKDKATGRRVRSAEYGCKSRWQVRWRDDAGDQRKRNFQREADANAYCAEVQSSLNRGTYVDPRAGRQTVEAYSREWRAVQLHDAATAELVERHFRLHVNPILGHLPLSRVRSSDVQAWVKDRAGELEPATLRNVYGSLAGMFRRAVIDRLIGVSPCMGIRLPDLDRAELVIPTPEQVLRLAAALPARYRAVPLLAAGTGLRGGELFGLEVDAVSFLGREVQVRQQLKVLTGRAPFLAPPKTKTSRRTVELPGRVAEALARHLEQFPAVEVEVYDETDPRRPRRRAARLLFLNARGNPVRRSGWAQVWAPAVAAAGLPAGFGLHGLRDFYATSLIHRGTDPKEAQLALGHTTPTITLNTYMGHWPKAAQRPREILDDVLGVPSVCPPASEER